MTWDMVGKGVGMLGIGGVLVSRKTIEDGEELVGKRIAWIRQGLCKLRELKQLEVELADAEWTDGVKVAWCVQLGEVLVASSEATEVKVVGVMKMGASQRAAL